VEAGVDQEVPEARVLAEERDDRELDPLIARHADAKCARAGQAPGLAVKPARRSLRRGAEERPQPDLRVLAPARDGQGGALRLGCGRHGREYRRLTSDTVGV
jgi:hypothetical protein